MSLGQVYEAEFSRVNTGDILSVPIGDIAVMPTTPVIYLFYGKGNELLYIGQSHNAQARWRTHRKYHGQVEHIGWVDIDDWQDMDNAEEFLIRKMRPRDNIMHNAPRRKPATKPAKAKGKSK